MQSISGLVVSVHAGSGEDLSKTPAREISVELDGIVGDTHRSWSREAWDGDKQPKGTVRRNERQWSAVSTEELEQIGRDMDLAKPLAASDLGPNLCLSGIPQLSRLPKGSLLKFPSGAELVVVEYNPPCADMGKALAGKYRTTSGEPPAVTSFSKAAKLTRGVVGIVDVPGTIAAGDRVQVEIYATPAWLIRDPG